MLDAENYENKFDGNELPTEFIIPQDDVFGGDTLSYKQQSDLHNELNKRTLTILEKAIVHVRKYDSIDTAISLMGKAFHRCPSMFVKKLIVDANKSLRAAQKAERWMNSRRRRKHVDESTVRRNIDTFYEKVSEAVAAIKLDLDKRNLTLFTKIKKQYESDLPLVISADKSYTIKKAHIVAMCDSAPNEKYKHSRLEANLFLIENVSLIGINTTMLSFQKKVTAFEKASKLAAKKGKVVYSQPIARPSANIQWFLVLDFGCNIRFASFADKLEITETNNDDPSYEGYIKRQRQEEQLQQQYKTQRLRETRNAFYEENKVILEDIKHLGIQIDNMKDERAKLNQAFNDVTNVIGENSGIDISQHRRLYDRSIEYRANLMAEGMPFVKANKLCLDLRIDAKTIYYTAFDIAETLRDTRNQLAFLNQDLVNRKQMYLERHGMVSMSKHLLEPVKI